MIDQLKKVFQEIEKLPKNTQLELAQLINDELNRDNTFLQNQDKLPQLALEALVEYRKDNLKTKDDFHKLIDKIEDESLLNDFYNLISELTNDKEGKLWNGLTPEQKEELLLSYVESKDPKNLISHEEVVGQFSKWLEK